MKELTTVLLLGFFICSIVSSSVFFSTGRESGAREEVAAPKDENYYNLASEIFLDGFRSFESDISGTKLVNYRDIQEELHKQLGKKIIIHTEKLPKNVLWKIFGTIAGLFLIIALLYEYLDGDIRKAKKKYWEEKTRLAKSEFQEVQKAYKIFNKTVETKL